MSKLVEKLERINEGRGQPLGFGAAANRAKILPMVLIAALPERDAGKAAATAAGVDAILITGAAPKKASEMPDIPWGVSLDSVTREDLERLVEKGCDFVVFSAAGSQAAALNVERIGKVLRIDASLDENLARSISRLPVDAVFLHQVGGDEGAITVEQLMVYERLAGGAGKHLIAAVPPGLPVDDIEILWGLGVQSIVVDLAVSDPAERLSQIREALEKLPAKRRKPAMRLAASLPVTSSMPGAEPPEEEDEE